MTAPLVGDLTGDLYEALPEVYRVADAADPTPDGWPLLRYLSTLLDQATPLLDLYDRFEHSPADDRPYGGLSHLEGVAQPWRGYGSGDYGSGGYGEAADTSDLVDPATADAGWLSWLAQLVGATLLPGWDNPTRRTQIGAPASGAWAKGTIAAITDLARAYVGGTGYVGVSADPESFGYITITVDRGALDDTSTYGALNAAAPSWEDLNGTAFGQSPAMGLFAACEPQRPAGFVFRQAYTT